MSPIDSIPGDPEQLRAYARRLEAELRARNAALEAELVAAREQARFYLHKYEVLARAAFGRRSERVDNQVEGQLLLLTAPETEPTAVSRPATPPAEDKRPGTPRHGGGGRNKLPPHIQRLEVTSSGDGPTTCACCGGELTVIGDDRSERLEYIPGHYKALVVVRTKRACKACPGQGVVTQPAPPFGLQRSKFADGFVAKVLVDKFADNIPLRRQVSRFRREGLDVPIASLCRVVQGSAELLKHVVAVIAADLRAGHFVQGDATALPILDGDHNDRISGALWVYLAFATERVWDPHTRVSYTSKLRVVDLSSGEERTLDTVSDATTPSFSPAGDRIAYSSQGSIATMRVDGTDLVDLEVRAWNPVWTRDGTEMWALGQDGDATVVLRIPIDPRTGTRAGTVATVFPMAIGRSWRLSATPDGRRLALDTFESVARIVEIPLDPVSVRTTGPERAVAAGSIPYGNPAVSPDGQWLAFTSEGVSEDLFVARRPDGAPQRLSQGASYTRGPRWSPDGPRLVFYGKRDEKLGVYAMQADGSTRTRLGAGPGKAKAWLPLWSPTGDCLALSIENTGPVVVALDAPWADQVAAGPRPVCAGWIATDWSRDGRWLAVSTGAGQIGRLDVATGEVEVLADEGYYPAWMPDGRRLVVGEGSRIFAIDAETRERWEVVSLAPAAIPPTPSIAVAPDGAALYVATTRNDGDLWLAELEEIGG